MIKPTGITILVVLTLQELVYTELVVQVLQQLRELPKQLVPLILVFIKTVNGMLELLQVLVNIIPYLIVLKDVVD
jgi:hypothetical protein